MRRVGLALSLLLATVLAVAVAAFVWGSAHFIQPGPLAAPTTVIVPRGAGLDEIARLLAHQGIIDNPLLFAAGVRLSGGGTRLQAGEYAVPAAISPRDLMKLIQSGKTVVRRFTVAEGLTTAQVLALLSATEGLTGPVPKSPGEGRLLPETYYFSYGDRRRDMVARMIRAMDDTLADLWRGRAAGLPFKTPKKALILASLIEKETAQDDERARIAAVFINRLRKGMKIQSDPTVAYAITGGKAPLARALTRADLQIISPYNTYVISGLPPGPIANPGRAAIFAALHPAATDDLYFVANGKGGHAFARTLKEHSANAARWRQMRKGLSGKNPPSHSHRPPAGASPMPSGAGRASPRR